MDLSKMVPMVYLQQENHTANSLELFDKPTEFWTDLAKKMIENGMTNVRFAIMGKAIIVDEPSTGWI